MQKVIGVTELKRKFRVVFEEVAKEHVPYVLTRGGRVGSRDDEGDVEELSHLSRGSSHVWTSPFTAGYRSAWDSKGPNSLRIAMNEGRIVGALILGNQELADPLRRLVEEEVDLSRYQQAILTADGDLPGTILKAWRDWHESWG